MGELGIGRINLMKSVVRHNFAVEDPHDKKYTWSELLFIMQETLNRDGMAYLDGTKTRRSGYKFFREFVQLMLYRNLANYDTMILLTGRKGSGKSSAGIMIAKEWCRLLGKKFTPERNIAYSNLDVINKIDNLDKYDVLLCDESIRFATTEEWSKKENKVLKQKLGQVRTKRLLYILCFPLKIEKVDKIYLNSYTNYWLDIYARGSGAVFVPNQNPSRDSWLIKNFLNLGSYNEFTTSEQVQKILKKHPNYWMNIKFPKPSKKLYDRYLKVRERNIYDDDNVMATISREDIYKALLVLAFRDVMTTDSTLTMNRIILHIKNEYDINVSKQMIESAIDDSKQLIIKIKESAKENA